MSVAIDVVAYPAQDCARLMLDACRANAAPQIVLAGGSTPKAANELFATAVRDEGVDLAGVTFWLGDDRAVPPDDDRSNYKMIKSTLLDPLADITTPVVHRIEGERGYAEAADRYEQLLRDAGVARFDLLLLGIGPDGHTLSLFPGKPEIAERAATGRRRARGGIGAVRAARLVHLERRRAGFARGVLGGRRVEG